MKSILVFAVFLIMFSSCFNKTGKEESSSEPAVLDSIQIVKKTFKTNPEKIEYEIPILRGTKLRHGVQKRFYTDGCLYSKIPYTRNIRNGVAYTYYKAYGGKKPVVWKEQPYVNGKLEGLCKRYHDDGKIQAEYSYKRGMPEVGLKEYSKSGKEIKLPTLILNKNNTNGYIQIKAKMSKKTKNVKYYTGVLVEGKYVSDNKKEVSVKNGVGEILIPATTKQKSITVIAMSTTRYRNKYITSKTISLK
jgi:hypothetical protein